MLKSDFHHVKPCPECRGSGEVMGAAMRIYCHKCEALGFLGVDENEGSTACRYALAKEVRRLVGLVDLLAPNSKQSQQVYLENSKGAGGSNYVGD